MILLTVLNASPDMPLPEPGNPGRAGAQWNNPNFQVNTGNIKKKPSDQLGMKSLNLSEKADKPLANTSTRDGNITNLGSTKMSRAVIEKYPGANDYSYLQCIISFRFCKSNESYKERLR
jgi:hypothetical protein